MNMSIMNKEDHYTSYDNWVSESYLYLTKEELIKSL